MPLPSEGKSLIANQILSRYLNWRLRYNYLRFRNTKFRHIGILLPVSISLFRRNRRVSLHPAAEFCPNRNIHCRLWRLIDFQDGGRQPCCICFGVMADHPWRAFRGLNSIFRKCLFVGLIVPKILRCINFGILAWNCLFTPLLWSFLGIFSPYDVSHRPDPQKDSPWAETSHLSNSA